jgi:hypothetical protein
MLQNAFVKFSQSCYELAAVATSENHADKGLYFIGSALFVAKKLESFKSTISRRDI